MNQRPLQQRELESRQLAAEALLQDGIMDVQYKTDALQGIRAWPNCRKSPRKTWRNYGALPGT
jgi:hypothetical protein